WGQWIARAENEALDRNFVLLIDSNGLASVGISPSTVLAPWPGTRDDVKPSDRATMQLLQSGAVFITDGDTLILSTSTLAEFDRGELSRLNVDGCWWVEPGRLQRNLAENSPSSMS